MSAGSSRPAVPSAHTGLDRVLADITAEHGIWSGSPTECGGIAPTCKTPSSPITGPCPTWTRQVIELCTHLDTLTAAVRATGRTLPVGTPTSTQAEHPAGAPRPTARCRHRCREMTSVYLSLLPSGGGEPVAWLIEV